MKLFYLALSLIFFFIPFSILGETMSDLIWNNGLYYKKGSIIPFDGIVAGEINGSFINGKKHGKWTRYYNNGRMFSISNYYLGLKNGSFITFSKNGQYIEKGKYKNNLEDGLWLRFFENGKINNKQLEGVRRVLRRILKKQGKTWLRPFPSSSVTKKPDGARMGKGKGNHKV